MNSTQLSVPDMSELSSVQSLCRILSPYGNENEKDTMFLNAMQEAVEWHKKRNLFYRNFLEQKNWHKPINDISDLEQFPLIHANFFKTHTSKSIPDNDVVLTLTSSGTTGQKSQMFFDAWSIGAGREMVDHVHSYFDLVTPETPTNYLVLNYEPFPDNTKGTADTSRYLTKYAPANELVYAFRISGKSSHEFDPFGCITALKRFESDDKPVRMIGFPALLFFILNQMTEMGLPPLNLPAGSVILTAGGWKNHASKEISRDLFHQLIEDRLGVPATNVRDCFGSVEHSVPYIECAYHHKHVPVWSHVSIRDVKTLEPAGYDTPGFLGAFAPHMTSVPAVGVLMGDLAVLHEGKSCPCGISAPWFEILGRAGVSKGKSCAASAAEMINRRR